MFGTRTTHDFSVDNCGFFHLPPSAKSSQRQLIRRQENMQKSALIPLAGLTLATTTQTRPHECMFTTAAHMEASFAAEPVKPPVKFSSGGGSVSSVISAAADHERDFLCPHSAHSSPAVYTLFGRHMGRGSPPQGLDPTPLLHLINTNYARGLWGFGMAPRGHSEKKIIFYSLFEISRRVF